MAFTALMAKLTRHSDFVGGKLGKGYDFETLFDHFNNKFEWFDEDFMNANRHWVKLKGVNTRIDNAWNIQNPQLETILLHKLRTWQMGNDRKGQVKVIDVTTNISQDEDGDGEAELASSKVIRGDVRRLSGASVFKPLYRIHAASTFQLCHVRRPLPGP